MTKADLMPFCSFDRPTIQEPWIEDGVTYATDGALALIITSAVEGVEVTMNPRLETQSLREYRNTFDPLGRVFALSDYVPSKDATPCRVCNGDGRVAQCNTCKGSGVLTCPTCENDHECRFCGGFGVRPGENNDNPEGVKVDCDACEGVGIDLSCEDGRAAEVEINGSFFGLRYLVRVHKLFPDARIYVRDRSPTSPAFIIFPEGLAILMPRRGP